MFVFENKLKLFIMVTETGRVLHLEKLRQLKDACTASDPAEHLDFQQLAYFTSNLLQSFTAQVSTQFFLSSSFMQHMSTAVLTMFGSTHVSSQSHILKTSQEQPTMTFNR